MRIKELDKNKIDLICHFLVAQDIPFTYTYGRIAILECFECDILQKLIVNYGFYFDGDNLITFQIEKEEIDNIKH